jgi:hypothetical protein
MKGTIGLLAVVTLIVVAGFSITELKHSNPVTPAGHGTVTERVEQVFFRTEMPHRGCSGKWRVCGKPGKIEAYGIDKFVWPHCCSACGQTNMIFNDRWPKIKAEWRVVK